MKVLNLYAGIGGNRKLWENVDVTAIEIEPEIAILYKKLFPNDNVLVLNAHDYLLKHYKEFDFIWSSPPCQSHSGTNNFLHAQGIIRYPDLKLYEEIIFLQKWAKCKWAIENVKPYYPLLIPAQKCGRHLFWANFPIPNIKTKHDIGTMNRQASIKAQKSSTNLQKDRLQTNAVNPKIGKHIFECAFKQNQTTLN